MSAAIIIAVGLLILFGWAFDILLLRRGLVGSIEVRPNAAICLIFAALAVIYIDRRAGRILALVPLTIGALTCVAYLFDTDFGIDDLLFDAYDTRFGMRMSVRAAVCSTFTGLALLFVRQRALSQTLAVATAFAATVSAIAYVYGASFLPTADVTPIAFSTTLLFLLWSFAWFGATATGGAAAAFLGNDHWGDTMRRITFTAFVAPAVFGATCLIEVNQNIFDFPFAVAMITTGTTFTIVITVAYYTARLREHEEKRASADTLYRTIVETSQEGICVADSTFRFTFVNERLAKMLGYTPAEMIGMHAHAVVHPEDRTPVVERAEVRRATGTTTRTTIRLLHRDGSIVHAISSAAQVRATPDSAGFILATLSDITDRVEAEAALRVSEARFRSIYEANLVGVAFWTFDGQVTAANDAFRDLFGLAAEELPGWRWSDFNTEEGHAVDQTALAHLQESGRCEPFEKEFVRRDGSRFFAIVAIAKIDETMNIGFTIDVTERTEARRAVERAHAILSARLAAVEGAEGMADPRALETLAARLSEAHEELETFSYSVSHDLRAPLRAIDGFSRELEISYSNVLDAQGQQYLKRVRVATARMSMLIDDLLSLSRLSTKTMRRTHVDVTAVAQEVAAEARERSGRNVTFEIEPNLTASADPSLLRVVFENVIGNAVKFSSRRDDARVEVCSAGDGAISVRDNGAGFDGAYAHKIFAPFQRLHTTEFEGTGIGLALVQRIVRRHGGTIHAESAPGQGATFTFTFSPPGEAA